MQIEIGKDWFANRQKKRQGIKSISDRQSKRIRSPSWYGGFERLHHSVTNRKEKKDPDLGSKGNKGKRTIRSRIKFRMQPNPNPREEQRPAGPTCRSAHTTAGHRSAGRRREPPVHRQTAAVVRNREPSRRRVEQRHARPRAQGTAPRPFDGGTLNLGRASAPAKSPAAAQSPPPASRSGGRRSTRSGGKERRAGKEKGRWQWTGGRIWRCAGESCRRRLGPRERESSRGGRQK